MIPTIASHTHSITTAADFKMMLLLFGGFGVLLTAILGVITTLCGVIYRNTKDKCRTCNERILGDINSVAKTLRGELNVLRDGCIACKAARKREKDAIWDHIDDSIWGALEKCCPRLSVEVARLWNRDEKIEAEGAEE